MAQDARILVIDDEVAARTALAELLREEGYIAETAGDGFKALARIEESAPDLLLLDLRMPSMDGFELMRRLRREEIHIPVVVMSAFGSVQTALDAMREGALDFVVKPLDAEQLLAVVERALRGRQNSVGTTPTPPLPLPDMVCQSSEMQHLSRVALQVAPSRATVLIVGERGSGRERLARALHSLSKRAQHPFVRLDCSELADKWTDDVPRMREEIQAAVRAARSGTLYLREVQELPIAGQAALLDFLPPVSAETSGHEIRLIASTDCDLRAMVAGGHFRSDLALILHVVTLHLPALRERRADIVPLAEQLIAQHANGHDRRISPELKKYLEGRVWYGNVKELDETVQEALSRAANGPLAVDHFGHTESSDLDVAPTIPGASLSDIERYAILKTLQAQGGSTSRAARILGISVRKIQYKLHEYGFSRLRSGSDPDAS